MLVSRFIYWYQQDRRMSKNTSISLGDHFTKFIDDQVEQGGLWLCERCGPGGAPSGPAGGGPLDGSFGGIASFLQPYFAGAATTARIGASLTLS